MIKISIAYVLLVISMAGPPLLLITVPIVVLMTRNFLRQRRRTKALAVQVAATKQNQALVRYFR